MKKTKTIIAVIVFLLILIVILQNTQAVETRLLFMKVTMPRALLLVVTLLVGFVIGIVAASHFSGKPGPGGDAGFKANMTDRRLQWA